MTTAQNTTILVTNFTVKLNLKTARVQIFCIFPSCLQHCIVKIPPHLPMKPRAFLCLITKEFKPVTFTFIHKNYHLITSLVKINCPVKIKALATVGLHNIFPFLFCLFCVYFVFWFFSLDLRLIFFSGFTLLLIALYSRG